jgi:uncharacterized protein (UPF0276 family)
MIPQIATPISHQFENEYYGKEIAAVSDCLEVRERSLDSKLNKQYLFHIDIDLTHEWDDELRSYLENALSKKPELKLITLQATRCCKDGNLVDGIFQLKGKSYTDKEMLSHSVKNTKWLRQNISKSVLIGLENNNYYPTPAYDIITEGNFISKVVYENNLFLLLDIAHAMVSAHNKNTSYEDYILRLPLDRLIQLHICQPTLTEGGIARDTHNEPNDDMFKEVIRLINKYQSIKYLTIEYYKDKDILITSINRLRQLVVSATL